MKLGVEQEYQLPSVPNYIIHKVPVKVRQDGWSEAPKTSIREFTDDQLREIGRMWTEALIEKARVNRQREGQ